MATLAVSFITFSNPWVALAAYVAASYVDQQLFGPHSERQKIDTQISRSEYGFPIPMFWGPNYLSGNMIWAPDYGLLVIKRKGYVKASFQHLIGRCRSGPPSLEMVLANDKIPYDSSRTDNKLIYGGTGVRGLNFYDGSQVTADANVEAYNAGKATPDETPSYNGNVYVTVWQWRIDDVYGPQIPNMVYKVTTPSVTLDMIYRDVCLEYGLVEGVDFDFSPIASIQVWDADNNLGRGWVWEPGTTGAEFLSDQVGRAYMVELVEIDGMISAVQVGGTSQVTVPAGDLGAHYSHEEEPKPYEYKVTNDEAVLPGKTTITYRSVKKKGERGEQDGRRLGSESKKVESFDLASLIDDDDAQQIAQALNDKVWTEREQISTALDYPYHTFVPTDVVTLPVKGVDIEWRIKRIERDALGIVSWSCVKSSAAVLTQSSGGGTSTGGDGGPTPDIIVPTIGAGFTDPETSDADAGSPRLYLVARGSGDHADQWTSCSPYYSDDGGVTWVPLPGDMTQPGIFGVASGALSDAGAVAGSFDTSNGVTVVLTEGGELVNTSEAAARNLVNYAWLAIGGTTGELIAFAGVALTGTLTYELSDILRGLRTSAMSGHAISDSFILLDPTQSAVYKYDLPADLAGTTIKVRLPSEGQIVTDGDVFEFDVYVAAPRGSVVDADLVQIFEHDWDDDGTQNLEFKPSWPLSADVTKQSALGQWATSTDGGATYTDIEQSAVLKASLDSGTLKARFTPIGTNGVMGTPIYSADYAYRTPPAGTPTTDNATVMYNDDGDLALYRPGTHPPVDHVVTSALPANTAVGATYVGNANGAFPSIDGEVPTVGKMYLLTGEADTSHNRPCTLTQVGDAGSPYILSIRGDWNGTNEVYLGTLIPIAAGLTHAGEIWQWISGAYVWRCLIAPRVIGEVPSGSITGTDGTDGNDTFTVPRSMRTNSEVVFKRGVRQLRGTDYNVSGTTQIVFISGSIPKVDQDLNPEWVTVDYDPA